MTLALYRIGYVCGLSARSVVRALNVVPKPGDRIMIDERTSLTVRAVVRKAAGSIAADVDAEETEVSEQTA